MMTLKGGIDVGYDADMSRKNEMVCFNHVLQAFDDIFLNTPEILDYGFEVNDDGLVRFEFEVRV